MSVPALLVLCSAWHREGTSLRGEYCAHYNLRFPFCNLTDYDHIVDSLAQTSRDLSSSAEISFVNVIFIVDWWTLIGLLPRINIWA